MKRLMLGLPIHAETDERGWLPFRPSAMTADPALLLTDREMRYHPLTKDRIQV